MLLTPILSFNDIWKMTNADLILKVKHLVLGFDPLQLKFEHKLIGPSYLDNNLFIVAIQS